MLNKNNCVIHLMYKLNSKILILFILKTMYHILRKIKSIHVN